MIRCSTKRIFGGLGLVLALGIIVFAGTYPANARTKLTATWLPLAWANIVTRDANADAEFLVGQVVDARGQSVGGIRVRDYTSSDSAITDPKGHFAFPYPKGIRRGWRLLYVATSSSIGFADFKDAPASPSSDAPPSIRITLEPRDRHLQGALVDVHGQPVSNATVCVNTIEMPQSSLGLPIGGGSGAVADFWNLLSTRSGGDGHFMLSLPAGTTVALRVFAPGKGTLQFLTVDPMTADLGTLTLPDGGNIQGRLTDRTSGTPIQNQVVRANRKSPDDDMGTVGNHLEDGFLGVTDNTGNFCFSSVRSGTYEVSVERNDSRPKNDLVPGPNVTVDVKPSETATSNLTMLHGQLVTGQIFLGNGNEPLRKETAIELIPGQYYGQYFYSRKDGTFTTYLLPGTYQFKVYDGSDEFGPVDIAVSSSVKTAPVVLRAGDDVTTISVVPRRVDGKPLPRPMFIWAYSWDNGQAHGGSCSGTAATFTVKKDSHPVFIVDMPGYAIWHSQPIDADTITAPVDAVLKPAAAVTVSGRIVDNSTGKPMAGLLVFTHEYLDGGIHWSSFGLPVTTDNDGRFSVPSLRAGDRVQLEANPNGQRGSAHELVIAQDASGMFGSASDGSPGSIVPGSGPIQLPEVRVNLRPVGYAMNQNFDQHPLPPLPSKTSSTIIAQSGTPQFWGIGVVLDGRTLPVKVQRVLPGGPAAKAGLQPGDTLLQADGKAVTNLADAIKWARGPKGTLVHLQIKRGDSVHDFDLTRGDISGLLPTGNQFGSSEQTGHDVDVSVLSQIVLPPNPTREQVTEYLQKIAQASSGQKRSSTEDPQVQMIERVGSENLAPLLDDRARFAGPEFWEMSLYIVTALEGLVGDKDKDLIIQHLNSRLDLMQIVVQHHWEQAAKPTIVAALKSDPAHFRYDWFGAAAGFRDPALYPSLETAFAHSPNKFINFQVLQNLPGFDLQRAVDGAWKNELENPQPEFTESDRQSHYGIAVIAARYGHLDALDYLFQALAAHSTVYNSWPDPRDAILTAVDFQGTDEQLLAWYGKNKDRLRYDNARKKFVLT